MTNALTTKTREEHPNILMLDANMTIADVSTLFETLKCFADSDQDLTLDGSEVDVIDTTSIQLLLAFLKQLEQNGCEIIWREPSSALCDVAKLLGLEDELELSDYLA